MSSADFKDIDSLKKLSEQQLILQKKVDEISNELHGSNDEEKISLLETKLDELYYALDEIDDEIYEIEHPTPRRRRSDDDDYFVDD